MPQISVKGKLLPESPIRKLVPFAQKAKEKGTHIYHLNIGQPDIETPEAALKAVRDNDLKVLAYTTSDGEVSYRKKLSKYYAKYDIEVSHNDILITTGASEALYFTIAAITDPHDEIIIPEPFYANYNSFALASGVNVVPLTSRIEDNFALPKISDFERVISKNTKAILICNPGNPTGSVYSKEEIQQLKNLVIKHDLFLIADEVYREFIYDGHQYHSVMSLNGIEQNAIMIDSISKRYSMCGARIGSVVTKNKELIKAILKMAQSRLSPPTYAQIAAEAALDAPESYMEEAIIEYDKRRNILVEELSKIEGVKVVVPKGAFYCLIALPVEDADEFAQWLLESYENNGETVMVAPASGFYSSSNIGKNQVRLAYVLNIEDLKRAVQILKEGLVSYLNTKK